MADLWWLVQFHVLRVLVGTPVYFLAAVKDGFGAFRQEFGRTFDQRWRASDAAEYERRFRKSGEGNG